MSLPLLSVPQYELDLISKKQTVKYRPFVVKEQKVLLTALNTGSRKDVLNSIMDIVSTCTFGALDVSKLPVFEVERLFLYIRSKSVGETVPVKLLCDDEACKGETPYDVPIIDKLEITMPEKLTETLKLRDGYHLVFSYPTIPLMIELAELHSEITIDFYVQLAKRCLRGIVVGEELHSALESTPEEKQEVFDVMSNDEYLMVQKYFDDLPHLSFTIDFKCIKCKKDNHLKIEGTDSFFG